MLANYLFTKLLRCLQSREMNFPTWLARIGAIKTPVAVANMPVFVGQQEFEMLIHIDSLIAHRF